jgi:hypothetical protein
MLNPNNRFLKEREKVLSTNEKMFPIFYSVTITESFPLVRQVRVHLFFRFCLPCVHYVHPKHIVSLAIVELVLMSSSCHIKEYGLQCLSYMTI